MSRLKNNSKDNPKLEQRELNDGTISLYLEYYLGRESVPVLDDLGKPVLYESGKMAGTPKYKIKHIRKKETLQLHLVAKPRTPQERAENDKILRLAKSIRQEREQAFLKDKRGYRLERERDINFLDFFQSYIDNYTKTDIRNITVAFKRFRNFLKETPAYSIYENYIQPNQLNKDMMIAFTEYLQDRSVGEGAKTIFQRFKKVVKYAVEHDIMLCNPCVGVSIKVDDNILKKEILSEDEMQQLLTTHYKGENPNIRRAFFFCLYTGMRFCDVKDLTFNNVDYSNKSLKFEQNKTKKHSANSGVTILLNDELIGLIGQPKRGQDRNNVIFPLPSHEMCLKALRHWTKRAGIEKHITWHCARHSFGSNMSFNGIDPITIKRLMGHSSLKHTEKYIRASDKLKLEAINSLPKLDLSNF